MSGSGKSTIAEGVKKLLYKDGFSVLILDGDDVRDRLHMNIGFSREDIIKNNSLIVDLCLKNRPKYDIIMVPIISPYIISRQFAKETLSPVFFEVFCKSDLKLLIKRDTKGLYAKAIRGELNNLIGFSSNSPYEPPPYPDIIINTCENSIQESVGSLYRFINSIMNLDKKL